MFRIVQKTASQSMPTGIDETDIGPALQILFTELLKHTDNCDRSKESPTRRCSHYSNLGIMTDFVRNERSM